MNAVPVDRPAMQEVLDLLQNPEFRDDARRVITQVATLYEQRPSDEERATRLACLGTEFENRWGVVPPTTGELLDQDARRWLTDAIASGQWGIVFVVASTTHSHIRAVVKKIRSTVRRRHQD